MNTPLSFTLDQVAIRVYRQAQDVVTYDITRLTIELNLYEKLASPQLTGTLAFVDSAAITSLVNFNGTEKLFVALTVDGTPFEREFYVVRAIQRKDPEASTSAVILEFCDKKSFISNFRRISHGYSGEISTLITKIYGSYFSEAVLAEPSVQTVNVVVPYLTPLAAAKWLCDRATTEFGEPFFLYTSLRGGNEFRSLGSMLQDDSPFDKPFVYTDTTMNTPATDFDFRSRQIISLEYEPEKSILDLARRGALKSTYISVDPLRKTIDTMTYDAQKSFDGKLQAGRLGNNHNMLIDSSFYIDNGEKLLDTPSASFMSVNPRATFDAGESFTSEEIPGRHLLKVDRLACLQLLEKQKVSVIVPGYDFLRHQENRTIGRKMTLLVKKDKPTHLSNDPEALIDKKRSGEYLIIEARHKFNMFENYVTVLTLARTSSPDKLDNSEEEPF